MKKKNSPPKPSIAEKLRVEDEKKKLEFRRSAVLINPDFKIKTPPKSKEL